MTNDAINLGNVLRQLRLGRKMTLEAAASRAGVTRSYLSQVERGRVSPSLATLKRIAGVLGTSLGELFNSQPDTPPERSDPGVRIVRKDRRKTFTFPNSQGHYELLTPDLTRKIEFILVTAEPGASSGDEDFVHQSEECAFVQRGTMELRVGHEVFVLHEGDCAYFDSSMPHRWRNVGNVTMEVLWVITPPTF